MTLASNSTALVPQNAALRLITQSECKSLLRADFEYIFEKYMFKTTPMAHQYASILWAMHRDCVMFFHDIGTGKTLAALYTLQLWDVKKTLVVCPCSVMSTWEDQVKEHTDLDIAVLYGEGDYRRKLMETDPSPIHVINYEGLKTIFGRKQKKAKGKGSEFVPDTQAIHKTAYDCIVFDECFPYSELVLTERGLISIGVIVENRLSVRVASFNTELNRIEWKFIVRYIQHPRRQQLVKVTHSTGDFVATRNHKVFCDGKFRPVHTLKVGQQLQIFPSLAYNGLKERLQYERSINLSHVQSPVRWLQRAKVLLTSLLQSSHSKRSRNEGAKIYTSMESQAACGCAKARIPPEDAQDSKLSFSRISDFVLRMVRKAVTSCSSGGGKAVLQYYLLRSMASEQNRLEAQQRKSGNKKEDFDCSKGVESRASGISCKEFQTDEGKQSNEPSRSCGKDEGDAGREPKLGIYQQRREFQNNHATKGCSRYASIAHRIFSRRKGCSCAVDSESTSSVRHRYCGSCNQSGDRNRWSNTSGKEAEMDRSTQDKSAGISRVEDITFLESASGPGFSSSSQRDQTVYNLEVADNHNYYVNGVLVSNCHHLKTFEALQTQIAYAVADYADKTLMLTGSPIAKDIRDFWSELMVLDGGQTLGSDQFMFLHTYMKRMTFEIKRGTRTNTFHEWYPKPGSLEIILEKMRQVVIRYDVHECFELPEKIEQIRKVVMSDEQRKLMKSIAKDFKLEMAEGKVTQEEIMNTASKMAQVASGFVLIKGEPHYLKKNPKLDELMHLLTKEITSKVIIFHQYVETAHLIEDRLRKAKIKFRSVRGEIPNVEKHIRDFQQKDDVRVLLAHPRSGGEGINLQMANIVIFFDQIYEGSTLRPQCIGRVWRKGQEEACVIIDLIIDDLKSKGDSIDKYIFKLAQTKGKLADKVLAWLRDL